MSTNDAWLARLRDIHARNVIQRVPRAAVPPDVAGAFDRATGRTAEWYVVVPTSQVPDSPMHGPNNVVIYAEGTEGYREFCGGTER